MFVFKCFDDLFKNLALLSGPTVHDVHRCGIGRRAHRRCDDERREKDVEYFFHRMTPEFTNYSAGFPFIESCCTMNSFGAEKQTHPKAAC